MNIVTRNRIRRRIPVLCDRMAWTFIVAAGVYVAGHVALAVWNIHLHLAWHGF